MVIAGIGIPSVFSILLTIITSIFRYFLTAGKPKYEMNIAKSTICRKALILIVHILIETYQLSCGKILVVLLDVIVSHSALVATGLSACYLKAAKSISKPEREIITIATPCIYFAPGHVFI